MLEVVRRLGLRAHLTSPLLGDDRRSLLRSGGEEKQNHVPDSRRQVVNPSTRD